MALSAVVSSLGIEEGRVEICFRCAIFMSDGVRAWLRSITVPVNAGRD